jgi:hypothetical protein
MEFVDSGHLEWPEVHSASIIGQQRLDCSERSSDINRSKNWWRASDVSGTALAAGAWTNGWLAKMLSMLRCMKSVAREEPVASTMPLTKSRTIDPLSRDRRITHGGQGCVFL